MTNPFRGFSAPHFGVASDIQPVTPSDTADLPVAAISLYIETGGAVVLDTPSGASPRTVTVGDNQLLPCAATRVHATGTTATGIHALVVV
jgi:hypothetical protein